MRPDLCFWFTATVKSTMTSEMVRFPLSDKSLTVTREGKTIY